MDFKKIKFIIKILITVLCFTILFNKININETLKLIKLIRHETILISIVIFILHYFLVTLRWQFYILKMNFKIPFYNILKIISLGLFSNQLFFGNLAMDALRIAYLKSETTFHVGLVSVFLDRFTALQSMWIILVIAYSFDTNFNNNYVINNLILFICFAGLFSIFLPLISFIKIFKIKNNWKILSFLLDVSRVYNSAFRNLKSFSLVYFSSFFILISSSFITWLICIDLGAELNFLESLIITLLGLLITAIPISINGWGIREISFISLLATLNISAEKSMLISLVFGLILLISSIIGMFFYFFKSKSFK